MPIKYTRTQLKNQRDLKFLKKAAASYKFDFDCEIENPTPLDLQEATSIPAIEQVPAASVTKQKRIAAGPSMSQQQKKKEVKHNKSSDNKENEDPNIDSQTEEEEGPFIVDDDDDDDDEDLGFDSQIF